MRYIVTCPECKKVHCIQGLEWVDIEEDMQGKDLLTFDCPACKKRVKAYVRYQH